jgi:uncharacterized repeat protein (TIGR02543 family)/flagellin-like protein
LKRKRKMARNKNVRNTTKFKRSIKAISPVIATLLMIAIAVVASLVVYAWVTGYIGGATDKAGNAIQIQSFAPKVDPADGKSKLVVYVQNVGQGAVQIKPGSSLYVNGDLVTITSDGPITIAEGQTVELLTDYEYSGEKVSLKVTTTGGTFTQTVGQSAPGHTSTAQLVKYSVDFILGTGGKTLNPIVTQAIAKGATVPISTTPDDGYTFAKWTSTGSITFADENSASTTATVNGAGSITATFTAIDYTITVNRNPTAGGTVTRDFSEPYLYNKIVTLTANPAEGYTFNGWSGDGVGSGIDRQVTVTGNMEVTANFAASPYEINVIIEPTAAGGYNRDKSPPYTITEVVTLTPTTNTGYTFSAWSGAGVNGAGNTRVITITGDMTVTATYTANPATLTTTPSPAEGGTIIKTPNRAYTYGETVGLEAKPSTGYSFTGWTGDLNEATNPTSIILDANIHSVTANFAKNQVGLTLVYDPTDGGTIAANPSKTTYYYGDTVELTANPSSTYSFSSWTSGLTGTANPQTITLTADSTTVTAKFNAVPQSLNIILRPSAAGSTTDLEDKGSTPNYACVNENPDNTNYYVRGEGDDSWRFDSYNIPDQSLSGTINSVTVYITVQKSGTSTDSNLDAYTVIRLNGGTISDGANRDLSTVTSWTTYSDPYGNTKPSELGGGAWSWTDINNLQIGVGLRSHETHGHPGSWTYAQCTSVWVEINYTPTP